MNIKLLINKNMKPTRTFSLIIALLTIMGLQTAFAQNRGTTGKSGNSTITKNFNVGSFSAIETDIVGNILFTQSDDTSVTAEGNEDLVNRLIVTVKEDELKLRMRSNLRMKFRNKRAKLTIKVSSPNLYKIDSDGVGNITLEGVVKTESLHIDSDGVGNIRVSQLECDQLTVESEGVGNIHLKGKGRLAEYESNGVGNVDAHAFIAEEVIVHSSGVGNIKCYASKNIELYGSGVGGIVYYGEPNIKALNKSGVGSIKGK